MKYYVADFESTTLENDCRVWAFAICDAENLNNVIIGTTLNDFMEWCKKQPDNPKIYFTNLKWDSQFIMYWLFHNGFRHVSSKERASQTFTTVISDKGLYYAIEVIFYLKGKKVNKVTFLDLLKLIPLSVEKIADAFKLPIRKGKIDYDAHNYLPEGSPITEEEKAYITNDVQIPAYALNYFLSQGLDRMTIGSCALYEYKNLIQKKNFKRYFPVPRYHKDIKQSYRGGYVTVNPKYIGKTVKNGIVLDKNSMYPWVMYTKLLPWGTPIFFKGEYKPDKVYPLYVQMIRCQFEIKTGKLPTVQDKNSMFYSGSEYMTSSHDQEVTLVLTNYDLEIFLKHYTTYNLEYISGWKFRGTTGLFKDYIDKWYGNKNKAREEENYGLELISKLFLNSLYGKFGTDITVKSKIPYLGADDVIHFLDSKPEEKDGIYIAMASFITSHARYEMITAAQTIMDDYNAGKSKLEFLYCDTDSLHIRSDDFSLPEGLEIDRFKLGAWKFESKFTRGRFLRSKCYIEQSTKDVYNDNPEYELKVTVAGMPESCKDQVNFRNFKIGATYKGKKQPKAVKGGVILQNIDFTIKK